MMEWQPIETAPRDHIWVLLAWDGETRLGRWLDNTHSDQWLWEGWVVPSMFPTPIGRPTHWMPLPSPPEANQ